MSMNDRSVATIPTNVEWSTMLQMGKNLLESGFLPESVNTAQKVVAIMQKGRELGVPPMHALSNIILIQGKPAANPELMRALIFRDHGDDALLYTHMGSDYCEIRYKRRNARDYGSMRFTWEDAIKAGLPNGRNGATWQKYPSAMLSARCTSLVAKAMFADSIGGLYAADEFDLPTDEDGNVVQAKVIDASQRQRDAPNRPQRQNDAPRPMANSDALHETVEYTQDQSGDVVNYARLDTPPSETTDEDVEDAKEVDEDNFHEEEDAPLPITTATVTRLWTVAKKNGWKQADVHELIGTKYPNAHDAKGNISVKFLTDQEGDALIQYMEPPV